MARLVLALSLIGLLTINVSGSFLQHSTSDHSDTTAHDDTSTKQQGLNAPLLSQQRLLSTSSSRKLAQSQRLRDLKGIAWVHIPRCGSSFVNVLIHHPGICPNISADEWVEANAEGFPLWGFFKKYPKSQYCNGGFIDPDIYNNPPGHNSVGTVFEQVKGHGVIMLRQPEQRILSAYHNFHMGVFVDYHLSAKEYGKIEAGCMVKMLVRPNHPNDHSDPHTYGDQGPCMELHGASPPHDDEIDMAKIRLRTGFPFVGITDEWDLSVCLFHVMFGGQCQDKMFSQVRPFSVGHHNKQQSGQYDVSELEGFVDEADGALYNEARQIFASNLAKYGVSESNCPQICK